MSDVCRNGHDTSLPGSRRGGRCVTCLRAKVRRAQSRYIRTPKGRDATQRYDASAKGEKRRFYARLRQRTAAHAAALQEML